MKLPRCAIFQPQCHLFHVQIYASFLLVLFLFSMLVAVLLWLYIDRKVLDSGPHLDVLIERVLPADGSPASLKNTLVDLAAVTAGPVALFAPDGRLIASSDDVSSKTQQQWVQRDPRFTTLMQDGRVVIFDWHAKLTNPMHFFGFLLIVVVAALGSWPLVRYLTRRLDALRQHADALAEGNLAARAEVCGNDEIAQLAHRFNQAAERIEALVNNQRAMLASASHELRSPLARIRMAVSLMGDDRPELHGQVERDIAELDALIGDLLLASSLSGTAPSLSRAPLDLLGLAAEEARRVGAQVNGAPLIIYADARLLRHLLRNLLENSRRHAAGSAIEVVLWCDAGQIFLQVLDCGPGVPEVEREKIFEPFYRPSGTVENGEGAGYGLALVRRIASLHGGSVVCLPRTGAGACFQLTLPGALLQSNEAG